MFNINNIQDLIQKAHMVQEDIQKIQNKIDNIEVTGESGAGMIKITINGAYHCKHVEINTHITQDKKKMLEDLIAAAFTDASRRIQEEKKKKINNIAKNIAFPNTETNPVK
ncbi:YbaB/EbfC family nucleoid-associated protein [Buchnera aphidicola]|uniref:Nucleoid-associated protein D9V79_01470 n=1 Tax=Buchnera aphidicola (Stegophylla sp.) TaxID=2315800 RepID=A0A4D6Y901_9GAMM|nr:YbaB/EbfC family nucleoid-associated protein [Buchnera aphidicola (Stegophylla sp.)]QCI26456.1 YbaB/EbfC family nucleoid-associated protein [Buchnera aphidicola (Stegophylla sp.)]